MRGGKDPEVKNDSKAQRLNSMGGQVSPHTMQENALAVHQGDGAEQRVVQKCILLLRQKRQHCHEEASDTLEPSYPP